MTSPQRMCAGCRGRADKPTLLRLVWDGGDGVLIDERQRLPGRGVYLHAECAPRALKTRAIGRGLRRSIDHALVGNILLGHSVG
ncbi:MAG: YlxR family protein [Micropruina sp.]|uniref:YlxR family protein n=1 Tax=Micropruina sp. TaxID=2737536 RepID=UPI0039E29349